MDELSALIALAENGTGEDRELDALVFCTLLHPMHRPQKNFFYTARDEWGFFTSNQPLPGLTFHDAPRYTSSIDDAITLQETVLPDCSLGLAAKKAVLVTEGRKVVGEAASMPRALLAATLRAVQSKNLIATPAGGEDGR